MSICECNYFSQKFNIIKLVVGGVMMVMGGVMMVMVVRSGLC